MEKNYWAIHMGRNNIYANLAFNEGFIGIGWNEIGKDLSIYRNLDKGEFFKKLRPIIEKVYAHHSKVTASQHPMLGSEPRRSNSGGGINKIMTMEKNPLEKKSYQPPDEYISHQDEVVIETKSSEAEARKSWENDFTDPAQHDDKKFCYIITGLGDMQAENLVLIALLKGDKYDGSQRIRLGEEPHKISEKEKISASVIDQDHRETYGNWGLILDVPFDNVIAAYSEEAGTGFGNNFLSLSTPKERKGNIPTAKEILEATDLGDYNEILLKGLTKKGQVRVKGIWAKVWEDREPVQNSIYEQAQRLAYAEDLPLVEIIKDIKKLNDEKATVDFDFFNKTPAPYRFLFQRNGKLYSLGFDKGEFLVIDEKYNSRIMRKDEFDNSYNILQQELDEEIKKKFDGVLKSLPKQFQEAEYKRRNPSPEILSHFSSKKPYAFALSRDELRYFLDFEKKRMVVIWKEEGYFYGDPTRNYRYHERPMSKGEFEYAKGEILKGLSGDELELFKSKIEEFENILEKNERS